MNRAIKEALNEMQEAADELADSADTEGCSDDLIVVSRSALSRLIYACTGEARSFEPPKKPAKGAANDG